MDIKRTPLALILAATMASTSYANEDASEYCRNGGSATGYTCDKERQVPDPEALNARALASTDEAWMESKLAEIKAWLRQEKSSNQDTQQPAQRAQQPAIAVRNPAATDPELMRIEAMSRKGDHRAAMSAVNSYMANNPASLEAKLTKSLILNNMGKFGEAEALLKNAIAQNPSSPELYNNLAVLYSEKGDYGKAIETLLQAFSTHPTYAQVHQNLRELYATVASQTYSRALDLDESGSKPDLVMLRRTAVNDSPSLAYQAASVQSGVEVTNLEQSKQPTDRAIQEAVTQSKATEPSSEPVVVEVSKPIIPAQTASLQPIETPVVESEPVQTKAPAQEAAVKTPKASVIVEKVSVTEEKTPVKLVTPEPKTDPIVSESTLVRTAVAHVNQWAQAWSAQDVDGYIDSYKNGFKPSNGLSNKAWKKQRNQRLTKPTYITVELSDISTRIVGDNTAKVAFTQRYKSNTYQDKTRKLLTLERVDGRWKIADERSI